MMNLLEYDANTQVPIIKAYESYFSRVKSPAVGSAQHYLDEHKKAKAAVEEQISKDPLGSQLAPKEVTEVQGTCAGIEDYRAEYETVRRVLGACGGPTSNCAITVRIPPRQGKITVIRRRVHYEDVSALDVPEVKERLNTMADPLSPSVEPLRSKLVLRKLIVGPDLILQVDVNEQAKLQPCQIDRSDVEKTPSDQLRDRIRNMAPFGHGMKQVGDLNDLIDKLNLESTRIEFAEQSLAVVESTLNTLGTLKRSYS
jgi:hypothetical protein